MIGPMHISNLNCVWMVGEKNKKYIDNKIKECLIKLNNILSPPSPHENYLNKELFLNESIIHIRGGGGWCYHKEEYHLECVRIIEDYIDKN